MLAILAVLAGFLRPAPARAADPPDPADRVAVVAAWQSGGPNLRAAAEVALLGTDAQVREFVDTGWRAAQRLDLRDAVTAVIAEGGPSVRQAAQRALDAADAGDENAVETFLFDGWRGPSDIDARLSVNQLVAAGGEQVRQAAQVALDADDPAALRAFLDIGWQAQWQTDQRLRVNQAMATGGPRVREAGQRALDAETPEALEAFLAYGWAVATAQDEETATLTGLLAQAQAAGELAAQETQQANQEAGKARAAAEAARRSAAEAAAATEAARNNTAQAAAHAKRAATAAQKAAQAAQVAVQAAAAASRAARAAATAAARAARAASLAGDAAVKAYGAAINATLDASMADAARQRAQEANRMAGQARGFADKAEQARVAIAAGWDAVNSANAAAASARAAAAANDEAVVHANAAGANASASVAAAARARANADRATRAARAAENYLRVAIDAAASARDAARRAADNAEAAARAAIDAAEHAGEAAGAAQRATEHANAATAAAQAAVAAATQAVGVYEAARTADAERLAVVRDQGIEAAQTANAEYETQRRIADWDIEEAAKRDAETNQLLAQAQNPATPPATALVAGRKVALALASAQGPWTQQAALAALRGTEAEVREFARNGVARAAAQDNRQSVMDLAITDNAALASAARTALAGTDTTVAQFLRTQNYSGRFTQDRLKINQILAAARTAGDVVLTQAAQQALDAESLPAQRDFLDTGQYTAAAVGERVRVNQILASAESGPEVRAAAQIALDGPPTGLREFLATGQYTAAERDYHSAVHLSVVGELLERINEVAETAVKNSLDAQAAAARARNDAAQANVYAQQALQSAQRAAGFAAEAAEHAERAGQSVAKAAAAVNTAKNAATRANVSARSAIRSAAWAVSSHELAREYAAQAQAAAKNAHDQAIAAGANADAAVAAAKQAYETFERAKGLEIAKCHTEYASGPSPELEMLLGSAQGEWYRACVGDIIADPAELARRAYGNASFCGVYPDGSQLYQNCLHSVLDPTFKGTQPLIFLTEILKGVTAMLLPVGLTAAVLCVALPACGAVAATILSVTEVGLNVHRLINGDQSLARTLLNLGTMALESLLLAGVGKLITTGFKAVKNAHVAAMNLKQVDAQVDAANISLIHLYALGSCLRHSFDGLTRVVLADGSRRPISEVRLGDQVRSTDPVTGQTISTPVTRLWRNHDAKLTDVTVADDRGRTTTLRTTPTHPFFSTSTRAWVDAEDLTAGQRLHTLDGDVATVTAVRSYGGGRTMFDLTVAGIPTYYVVAGTAEVLVHNTSCWRLFPLGGGNWFRSPAGLDYGPDQTFGHRILHVMAHTRPDPTKPSHGVFDMTIYREVLQLVDEAWDRRALAVHVNPQGSKTTFVIPMGRRVGTNPGEDYISITVEHGNEVITAFPRSWPSNP